MRPKLDLPNCLAVLKACAKRPRTAEELQGATGISRTTFFRVLIDLREQLGAHVVCEDGQYRVKDWGIIRRSRVA